MGRTALQDDAPKPAELQKWPLRRTFAFLLMVGGVFWAFLGLALKLIVD